MIDTTEIWYISTADIPGSFLQTDYDKEEIHINMEESMVTLIEEIEPDYYKDFIYIDFCRKMHAFRSQERYIWNCRSITILLDKTLQNPRRYGLP